MRMYSLHSIRWLVGQFHVSRPDFTIAREMATRAQKTTWPRKQILMAIRDGIKIHHENQELYTSVMTGRF